MRTIEASNQDVFKALFELVKEGEAVKIQGPSSGVVVMPEVEYNEMAKAQRNTEYLAAGTLEIPWRKYLQPQD